MNQPSNLLFALPSLSMVLPAAAVALVAAGLLVGLWLLVGPGPRRRRAYDRALRLLQSGAWQEALAAVTELRHLGRLSSLWEGRARNAEAQCHSLAGDQALQEKRFEDALEHHLAAARLFDTDAAAARDRVVQAMLAEVRRLFATSQGPDAARVQELITRVLAVQQPCAEATFWLGLCRVREGRIDEALASLHEARAAAGDTAPPAPATTPPAVDPPFYAGALLLRQGKAREALQYLGEANRLAPGSPFVAWQLGQGIVAAGGDRLAVRALQRALAPQGLPRWTRTPERAWVEGLPESSYVRRLAQEHPYRCPVFGADVAAMVHQARMALAQAHYRLGHFADAAESYNAILQDSPPSTPVLRGLGLALARLERYDEAFKHLRMVHAESQQATGRPVGPSTAGDAHDSPDFLVAGYLALSAARGKPLRPEDRPNNILWAVGLLGQYDVRGHAEWAGLNRAVFAEARTAGVAVPVEAQRRLADVLASVDAADQAAAVAYDELAAADPAAVRLEHACLYARAAQQHGVRSEHELRLFEQVFADQAGSRAFYQQRGWDFDELVFFYLERWATAQPGSFPSALGPDFPARGATLLLERSRRQEEAGHADAARATLETLLALAPGNPRGLDRLAYLCHSHGDLGRAAELLDACRAADPHDYRPLVRKAIVEARRGRRDACFTCIDDALARTRGRARAAVAVLGAKLALGDGQPAGEPAAPAKGGPPGAEALDRARHYLQDCLAADPQHPEAVWWLLAVRLLQGDRTAVTLLPPGGAADAPNFAYLAAVAHLLAGQYERAVQAADQARQDPTLAVDSAYVVGLAYKRGNDTAAATTELEGALAGSPDGASADHVRALLARNRFAVGAYADAARHWKALPDATRGRWRLDDPLRQTVYLLGLVDLRAGRYEEAAESFAEATRLGLECTRLLNLCRVQAARRLLDLPEPGLVPIETDRGRPTGSPAAQPSPGVQAAARLLEDARQADPANVYVAKLLAMVYRRQGHWEVARDALHGIAQPDAATHFQMGLCSLHCGQLAQAAQEFTRALQEEPTHAAAGYNLLLTHLSLGHLADAAALLDRLLGQADRPEGRLLSLLRALLHGAAPRNGQGAPDVALQDLTRQEEHDLLGLVRGLGNLDVTQALLRPLVAARPDSPAVSGLAVQATLLRARGLLDRCRWADARALLAPHAAAKVTLTDRIALLNLLGCAACLCQDFEAGVKFLALVTQLTDDCRPHQNLALAYELHAQPALAERQWDRYLELVNRRVPAAPNQPDYVERLAHQCLSRLATRAGDKEQWSAALGYLQRAHDARPNDVEVLERLFQLHQQLKRPDDARRVLRQIQRLRPDEPQYVLYRLELLELRAAEDVEQVVGELQQVVRQNAGKHAVQERAATLLTTLTQALNRLCRGLADQLDRTRARMARMPDYQVDWPEVHDFSRHMRTRLGKLRQAAEQVLALAATDGQRRPVEEVLRLIDRQLERCKGLARSASRR